LDTVRKKTHYLGSKTIMAKIPTVQDSQLTPLLMNRAGNVAFESCKKIKFCKRLKSPSESKFTKPHCKEPKPKIRKKYSQKSNCAATVPISTFMCVCEGFIYSHDGSAYFAAGNMWTDPGNI
jgi:hypothetical protein